MEISLLIACCSGRLSGRCVLLAVPWVLDIECRYCVVVQSREGGYLYLARDEDMACDQALLVAASLPRECISVECVTALDYCSQY